MSDPEQSSGHVRDMSGDEIQSALFAQLVVQQSGMAMMLMGKSPHPETGKTMRDLDAAQVFIGQLEMLETKTRGNLSKSEEALLKQTLMTLRMTFVEAVEQPKPEPEEKPSEPKTEPKPTPGETEANEESKKRFSKKFSL
jgi:Domain of unknown function (DUF1844)